MILWDVYEVNHMRAKRAKYLSQDVAKITNKQLAKKKDIYNSEKKKICAAPTAPNKCMKTRSKMLYHTERHFWVKKNQYWQYLIIGKTH